MKWTTTHCLMDMGLPREHWHVGDGELYAFAVAPDKAQFIVNAMNAHDSLVAACVAALVWMEEAAHIDTEPGERYPNPVLMQQIAAALALAGDATSPGRGA